MEGYSLIRSLREMLNEPTGSSFMNDRTSYDNLYHAVQDFNVRTHFATSNQVIAITANVASYELNADYCGLALTDIYNRPYVKHTYNGSDTFIFNTEYSSVVLNNDTSTAAVAQQFAITDATQLDNITGTATSTIAQSNGESILIDTAADFSGVAVGDYIHNTTDDSNGIVIKITSATQIICALFEGTLNSWTIADAYVITPQTRYNIVLSPTPSDTATLTVPYIVKPTPVYSPYRSYKLPSDAMLPIVHYAAFLYKFRDSEPDFGNAFYKSYDMFARKVAAEIRKAIPGKSGFRVNMSKMNKRSTGAGAWSV